MTYTLSSDRLFRVAWALLMRSAKRQAYATHIAVSGAGRDPEWDAPYWWALISTHSIHLYRWTGTDMAHVAFADE